MLCPYGAFRRVYFKCAQSLCTFNSKFLDIIALMLYSLRWVSKNGKNIKFVCLCHITRFALVTGKEQKLNTHTFSRFVHCATKKADLEMCQHFCSNALNLMKHHLCLCSDHISQLVLDKLYKSPSISCNKKGQTHIISMSCMSQNIEMYLVSFCMKLHHNHLFTTVFVKYEWSQSKSAYEFTSRGDS